MKLIVAAVLCTAAVIGQISTASAQYYRPFTSYQYFRPLTYYYGSPAGSCCALTPLNQGWIYTRDQPVGDGQPYAAVPMADGSLACSHSNYRPIRGLCQRIW